MLRLIIFLLGSSVANCFKAPNSVARHVPIVRLACAEDLAVARAAASPSERVVVFFQALKCRRCRATHVRYEQLAREWPDADTHFFDIAVEDDEINRLATAQGIKYLPAIRVFTSGDDANAACAVRCGSRGTGRVVNLSELRQDLQACMSCDAEEGQPTIQVHGTPGADLIYAALPVSLVYVLMERLSGIEADLFGI